MEMNTSEGEKWQNLIRKLDIIQQQILLGQNSENGAKPL